MAGSPNLGFANLQRPAIILFSKQDTTTTMMLGLGFFGMFFMFFFFIIIIVVAIAAISWLFPRSLSTPPNPRVCVHPRADSNFYTAPHKTPDVQDPQDPLEILKRRYARGEITREEYETMKEDILA